jgi:hypothetical protein
VNFLSAVVSRAFATGEVRAATIARLHYPTAIMMLSRMSERA